MLYNDWGCKNSAYWSSYMSIGAFVTTIGVISLILIWLFQALKKEKPSNKKKLSFWPVFIVSVFSIAGISLLVMKNDMGYLFVICGLMLCAIMDKNSIYIILSLISLIFGVSKIATDNLVPSSLIVLSVFLWIYFWITPVLKNSKKKEKLKVLIPTIISFVVLVCGLIIMCYVAAKTASLSYCWGGV